MIGSVRARSAAVLLAAAFALTSVSALPIPPSLSELPTPVPASGKPMQDFLEVFGFPTTRFLWTSVDQTADGFIAHGVHVDVSSYPIGLKDLPLGDWHVSEFRMEGNYPRHFRLAMTGLSLNLDDLRNAGQQMMASKPATGPDTSPPQANVTHNSGMQLTLLADYLKGMGYKTLTGTLDVEQSNDLDAATATGSINFEVNDMFRLSMSLDTTGISRAVLDDARAQTRRFYQSNGEDLQAEMERDRQDPNSPDNAEAFSRITISYVDEGLFTKLSPILTPLRARVFGNNPDGTPATSLSEDKLNKIVSAMAARGQLSADKLHPFFRAIFDFMANPKTLSVTARFNPPIHTWELPHHAAKYPAPPGYTPSTVGWNDRVTLNASN